MRIRYLILLGTSKNHSVKLGAFLGIGAYFIYVSLTSQAMCEINRSEYILHYMHL